MAGVVAHRHHVRHGTGYRDRVAAGRPIARLEPDLDRAAVDGLELAAEPRRLEHDPVRRIGIGDDHGRTGADVVLVDVAKQVPARERRRPAPHLVVHRRAAALELGPGPAVEQEHLARGEAVLDDLHRCVGHRLPRFLIAFR